MSKSKQTAEAERRAEEEAKRAEEVYLAFLQEEFDIVQGMKRLSRLAIEAWTEAYEAEDGDELWADFARVRMRGYAARWDELTWQLWMLKANVNRHARVGYSDEGHDWALTEPVPSRPACISGLPVAVSAFCAAEATKPLRFV